MGKRNDEKSEPLFPIETHFKELQVSNWIEAGMMAETGWGAGKEVTRSDFLKARDAFLKRPMSKEVK